ncbi:CbtA family protein [Halohasta salina]|uniref:CbtA family protein n=1 Tax=Halohasta salina TaxID=2961621 RepID=UPI0020A3F113|nr:CbtA family protein [Halohasta salina]
MLGYLTRGVSAGAVAGVAYGLFTAVVVGPLIAAVDHAGHDHGHHAADAAAVAEPITTLVSVGGGLVWAIFLGGLFGLALFVLEPALPGGRSNRQYVLAGCGFLTVSAIPWLVLPPATPASQHLYGVDARLAIYAGLVGVGAVVSAAAVAGYRRMAPRHRLLGVATGLAPVVGAGVVLPAITPTVVAHPGLSTEFVAAYQATVVLGQAGIWFLIAVTFGWLQRRTAPSKVAGATEPTPAESA